MRVQRKDAVECFVNKAYFQAYAYMSQSIEVQLHSRALKILHNGLESS